MIEFWIVIVLLAAFAGTSIWVMLLLERIEQLKGYIKRIEKFDSRKWHKVDN